MQFAGRRVFSVTHVGPLLNTSPAHEPCLEAHTSPERQDRIEMTMGSQEPAKVMAPRQCAGPDGYN
jgi:hypothetical protein